MKVYVLGTFDGPDFNEISYTGNVETNPNIRGEEITRVTYHMVKWLEMK